MLTALPWILACAAFCLLGGAAALLALTRRAAPVATPPAGAAFATFPVFDPLEHAAFQALQSALPDCVVLAKLPLQRFCRPASGARTPQELARLGDAAVDFAVCSASGRVLAAVDLERGDETAADLRRWKAGVLRGCRVRYLRCAGDAMPSADELRALAGSAPPARRHELRRAERRRDSHLWLAAAPRVGEPADAEPGVPPWIRASRRADDRARGVDAPAAAVRH